MPNPSFVDWRDGTPKLWARFTSRKFPEGVYHAFYSLLDEPLPENRRIIPQSVCGLVYEESVSPEPAEFWPPDGLACSRCFRTVTTQNQRALARAARATEVQSAVDPLDEPGASSPREDGAAR